MTIIDSQFYIIDSFNLEMFHCNEMLTWWFYLLIFYLYIFLEGDTIS